MVAAALALAACGRSEDLLPPAPEAVVPASAHTERPVPIAIHGDHFNLFGERRLGSGSALDAAFRATLGGVALLDVRWMDNHTLSAVVPAGVSGDDLELVLDGPTGHAILSRAFRASPFPPASLAVSVAAPAQVESLAPFPISVTVANTGGTRLNHVQTSLSGSGFSVSAQSSDLTLEAGATATIVYQGSASVRGPANFAVSASGTDDFSGERIGGAAATGLQVLAAAALRASPSPAPVTVSVGQQFTISVDVTNDGDVAADAVSLGAPVLGGTGGANLVGSGPYPQTIAGGQTVTLTWTYEAAAAGDVALGCSGTGNDAMSGSLVPVGTSWPALRVQSPPSLTARIVAPTGLLVGDEAILELDVANGGDALALAVIPSLDVTGTGLTVLSTPAPQDVPGHQGRKFLWQVAAVSAGTVTVSLQARGTDANSGAGVSSAIATASIPTTTPGVTLVGILVSPPGALPAETFTASFTVTNTGSVAIDSLSPSLAIDSGAATVQPSPVALAASLAPGATATYSWTVLAGTSGSANLTATVTGTPRGSGAQVSASGTAPLGVAEAAPVAEQPFGDDSAFANVFAYQGRLYSGPNRAATGGARMQPNGTGREAIAFALAKDTTGYGNLNTAPGPYPSFGAPGCPDASLACGPDNENARGFLGAVPFQGNDWMIGAGAIPAGDNFFHFYASNDPSTAPAFSYVDVDAFVGNGMKTVTAAVAFGGKVYVGLSGTGGARPGLIALSQAPLPPGLDATAAGSTATAANLQAENIPGIGKSAKTSLIDSLIVFNDRLYVFNNGGCARSNSNVPAPGSWNNCTPAGFFPKKNSVTTSKTGDLLPADKAFPATAVWNGRLYAARNTAAGPQLWVCDPGADGNCGVADWQLVARNGTLDAELTQFDDAGNKTISLLAATANHLYVGFDNASGVQLYRAQTATPINQADFAGASGCNASQHATAGCAGIGGGGLGAGATRFFDGKALAFPSGEQLFVAAGNGATAARLFRFAQ